MNAQLRNTTMTKAIGMLWRANVLGPLVAQQNPSLSNYDFVSDPNQILKQNQKRISNAIKQTFAGNWNHLSQLISGEISVAFDEARK